MTAIGLKTGCRLQPVSLSNNARCTERKLGEMLKETEKNPGVRHAGGCILQPPDDKPKLSDLGIEKGERDQTSQPVTSAKPKLEDLGIQRMQSSRWQKIAEHRTRPLVLRSGREVPYAVELRGEIAENTTIVPLELFLYFLQILLHGLLSDPNPLRYLLLSVAG